LTDGASAKDGDLVVGVHGCVLDGVVRCGQDVREVESWKKVSMDLKRTERFKDLPFSSETSSGIFNKFTSPSGTRTYSA
jgi:hypothetical protein